jgi:hypothetical protein
MVYALHETERDAMRASVVTRALAIDGVEHVMWLGRDAHDVPSEGIISSPFHGELRFARAGRSRTRAASRWSVEGPLAVIDAAVQDGRLHTPAYPDALARVWSALTCQTSGEVLLSAGPGYEFVDWGRQAHVGGGSHGSLHASDSLGALVLCGVELPRARSPRSGRSATSPRSCPPSRRCARSSARNSVLTANGPRHLRQRKLLLPPFHGEAIERYVADDP